MFYRAIGLMSGSSLDGLDIVFVEFDETGGKWSYHIKAAACYEYNDEWTNRLKAANSLLAHEYLLLHSHYGKYLGEQVNRFIDEFGLHHQVQLITSHGHTTFHAPQKGMTAQLGDGAAIAATTGINVVSELRVMDVALGGQGAPIVPMGEKLLLNEYSLLLNIGGIANISFRDKEKYVAFDICPANKVLNLLAGLVGKKYDEDGWMAASGNVLNDVSQKLNNLNYYKQPHPKSLANEFGSETVYNLLPKENINDALRTYVEHIAIQLKNAIINLQPATGNLQLLVTGGGAHNKFLIERIKKEIAPLGVNVVIPDEMLINYKEALVMALLGVLRWREQNTVMSSVTGAKRDSIGGAVWIGQEA